MLWTKSKLLGLVWVALSAMAVPALTHAQMPESGKASYAYGQSKPLPGRYIVLFKPTVTSPGQEAARIMQGKAGQVHHVYSHALKGFAATLPEAALPGIRNNPLVADVVQDQSVSLNTTQSPATWGIDRLDQRALPLSGNYSYNATGSGVYAFIIDTGILSTHAEFAGRVLAGADYVVDGKGTQDCNGHGTHVSGTVAGTTYGVAKLAKLVPVRVLDCAGSGAYSAVIAGIDWVAGSTLRPAVANMSLGGGYSSALNAAVAGAVSKGVTMVVAAGNSNADACSSSPASEPSAITVGATTSTDARASYSNYGSCLDIFAPGSNITSAWNTADTATNTISGTSMASPHVAGVAALLLQSNAGATPADVTKWVKGGATANVVTGAGTGSPNLLAYALLEPGQLKTVYVSSILVGKTLGKSSWTVVLTPTVVDTAGNPVSSATVAGSFSPGSTASCTTASNGTCSLSATFRNTVASTKFTVNGVTGAGLLYDSSNTLGTVQLTISYK